MPVSSVEEAFNCVQVSPIPLTHKGCQGNHMQKKVLQQNCL